VNSVRTVPTQPKLPVKSSTEQKVSKKRKEGLRRGKEAEVYTRKMRILLFN
jgi:hypothetical protein